MTDKKPAKKPTGRPTKYNAAMQRKAEKYINGTFTKKGEQVRCFQWDGSVIPSVEGLAEYLNVGRANLYKWSEKFDIFRDTLADISEKQKSLTLNNGLTGDFNATIAKLVLANHGMHDKVDNEFTGKNGQPIQVEKATVIQPVMTASEAAKQKEDE